ncbi:MAG: carboxypeptidase-like regulatory domain-containing protein [Gemmatimonas sp.]
MPWKTKALRAMMLAAMTFALACGGDTGSVRGATTPPGEATSASRGSPLALANAAGGAGGYAENASAATGSVSGIVQGDRSPPDTTVVPTHDLLACSKFTRPLYPSMGGGVGNAVVWLSSVASGRANELPRRVTVTLQECELQPRVELIAAGGTVIVSSRDKVMSRLRFAAADTGVPQELRATVALNDAGQVVPLSDATKDAGLVTIRDDLHPWVRGYLAVAPHPFVSVTSADGKFTFHGVPAGSYTLVTWHEQFGVVSQPVTVRVGRDAHVEMTLRE